MTYIVAIHLGYILALRFKHCSIISASTTCVVVTDNQFYTRIFQFFDFLYGVINRRIINNYNFKILQRLIKQTTYCLLHVWLNII
ncbi:hypothetical protein SAMN04488069_105320 [Hymenobacter psychrophilus]|uniref:Uncharacterized protein n=1 Tax=Hymenobacter psychrophilus TaxID=651662 RepID=A0A1H3H8P8_9BACT|nr:hypothetical protein SAMN04488069_105320 [Hymenobacter psychrophilus]